jgi:hypothetical protein
LERIIAALSPSLQKYTCMLTSEDRLQEQFDASYKSVENKINK